jgi:hypothetical protein
MTEEPMTEEPMTEEPTTEPGAEDPPSDLPAGPSTDLVLPARGPAVAPARRWPEVVLTARSRLLELRQSPVAMVSVSAAATVGSALLTAGLRRVLRQTPLQPAGRTTSVAVGGYVLHEVHVIHHVVHHVVRSPAD